MQVSQTVEIKTVDMTIEDLGICTQTKLTMLASLIPEKQWVNRNVSRIICIPEDIIAALGLDLAQLEKDMNLDMKNATRVSLTPINLDQYASHKGEIRVTLWSGWIENGQVQSGSWTVRCKIVDAKDPVDDVISKIEKIRETLLKMQANAKTMQDTLAAANNFGLRSGNLVDRLRSSKIIGETHEAALRYAKGE